MIRWSFLLELFVVMELFLVHYRCFRLRCFFDPILRAIAFCGSGYDTDRLRWLMGIRCSWLLVLNTTHLAIHTGIINLVESVVIRIPVRVNSTLYRDFVTICLLYRWRDMIQFSYYLLFTGMVLLFIVVIVTVMLFIQYIVLRSDPDCPYLTCWNSVLVDQAGVELRWYTGAGIDGGPLLPLFTVRFWLLWWWITIPYLWFGDAFLFFLLPLSGRGDWWTLMIVLHDCHSTGDYLLLLFIDRSGIVIRGVRYSHGRLRYTLELVEYNCSFWTCDEWYCSVGTIAFVRLLMPTVVGVGGRYSWWWLLTCCWYLLVDYDLLWNDLEVYYGSSAFYCCCACYWFIYWRIHYGDYSFWMMGYCRSCDVMVLFCCYAIISAVEVHCWLVVDCGYQCCSRFLFCLRCYFRAFTVYIDTHCWRLHHLDLPFCCWCGVSPFVVGGMITCYYLVTGTVVRPYWYVAAIFRPTDIPHVAIADDSPGIPDYGTVIRYRSFGDRFVLRYSDIPLICDLVTGVPVLPVCSVVTRTIVRLFCLERWTRLGRGDWMDSLRCFRCIPAIWPGALPFRCRWSCSTSLFCSVFLLLFITIFCCHSGDCPVPFDTFWLKVPFLMDLSLLMIVLVRFDTVHWDDYYDCSYLRCYCWYHPPTCILPLLTGDDLPILLSLFIEYCWTFSLLICRIHCMFHC